MLDASTFIFDSLAAAFAPAEKLTVSEWADEHRILSVKGSAEPGKWRTSRNPPLREPMDRLSETSPTQNVVLMFPIQFGKTEIAVNWLGYGMTVDPGPIMVCLPGEVSMNKWSMQKLQPTLDETPALKAVLTSSASRETANQRFFKDFRHGQLYLEHAGAPARLKSTSVKKLIVDELDEFSAELKTGDDPVSLLRGRTSAFPSSFKILWISTPTIKGLSRIEVEFEKSDQRYYHVPCPDCGHMQPLVWSGLHFSEDRTDCWYCCRACGVVIREHQKTGMIAAGKWVPTHPERDIKGYTINCLYYPAGLGPRWTDLMREWLDAQNDPAKLKTFCNDRLAEPWLDPSLQKVQHNLLQDRAEPYRLRTAPKDALVITAGIDTQDNRLEVQILGWGRNMRFWTIDYVALAGDPADEPVWTALTELLNRGIEHESGAVLEIVASAQDAGGHRGEAVKNYHRKKLVRRGMAIYGAKPNNAPVLSKGKMHDVNYGGQYDKNGVMIYQVGTVSAKNWLYGRLATDAEKASEDRLCHFSDDLPDEYFRGLVSETFNPSTGRFVHKRGVRNEPLDTWVYAYAAAHHQELRLHRWTNADWDAREAYILRQVEALQHKPAQSTASAAPSTAPPKRPKKAIARRGGLADSSWGFD